ncbi:MAG: amino acid adenylation domain-containing protein, partial [Acidobacteria bacterium]|nr:amino acid adenylation domain-containing protein [Acidobacteriota bacterium]
CPIQVIHPFSAFEIPIIDLSNQPLSQRESTVFRRANEEAQTSFDLSTGPLVRVQMLRVDEQEHVLLLTTHHIVFDGWSRAILLRELAGLYDALSRGHSSPFPDLPLQYSDFSVWQNDYIKGEVLAKQIVYWKEKLARVPGMLDLPTDHARPAVSTFRGGAVASLVSAEVTERLRRFAQQHGATLFMVTLAVFKILLARYSGQDDIVVGSPIAGRNRKQLEDLIGFFANTLVLRTDLSGNPSFRELVLRVRETALGAYAHQDIPFEKLVEELHPQRSLSHNPLFQVLFAFRNVPTHELSLANLQLKLLPGEQTTAKFDLALFVSEENNRLCLRWEYNSDLFQCETVERMSGHFAILLENALARTDRPISELELLTVAERQQLLCDWNNTWQDYPREQCLHELFEQQVERRADTVAVKFGDQQLSYAQLNAQANQLAHYLVGRGIGPGERIGIYLERSLDLMVALLAVQKAGAAYVPLDPDYPGERIHLILADADLKLVISQRSLTGSLPRQGQGLELLSLDAHRQAIERESTAHLATVAGQAEDLMYVIFTSGSTGRPKGVQVPHRAVVNLLTYMKKVLNIGGDDVFPALASFAFDMSVPELYLALIAGGQVAMGERGIAANGEELARWLRQVGATIVHATPTLWRLLLDAGFSGQGLKRVIGAEAFPQELANRLLEAEPSLYNFYGPTETTVWSTMHHFRCRGEPVTIGRPIANTRTYVLDGDGQAVPIGVVGEIYIGGEGVSCGYLRQPDLTAARFLRDRFRADPSAMMYRTGDLGRYLPDGKLELLGRTDDQVKLRGFRIELGEIEAVLAQHPAVEQCVVVAREDLGSDKQLVGYVVQIPGRAVSTQELRAWLRLRLPDYMVPHAIADLAKLPLSPNGKVNRKALPRPDYQSIESRTGVIAPRTPLEEIIAAIWQEVLRLESISVRDNFFELGGHSLTATQVASRIRDAFAVELPLRMLFE